MSNKIDLRLRLKGLSHLTIVGNFSTDHLVTESTEITQSEQLQTVEEIERKTVKHAH